MSALLHGSRASLRGAPWILAVWIVIAIGLVVFANSVGRPENDNLDLPGTSSQSATNLLDQKLPDPANGSVPIVLQSDYISVALKVSSGDLDDDEANSVYSGLRAAGRGIPRPSSSAS